MIPVLKPHNKMFLQLSSDKLIVPDKLTLLRVFFTQRSDEGLPTVTALCNFYCLTHSVLSVYYLKKMFSDLKNKGSAIDINAIL